MGQIGEHDGEPAEGERLPVSAWLGFGGNVGDVSANMALALNYLLEDGKSELVALSSQYRTPPWGYQDQDWFINACAEIATRHDPFELLMACMAVEQRLYRVRERHWGPRSMDIDILLYGDAKINSQRLTIPHPAMLERAFVLVPLAEIAPALTIGSRNIADWALESNRKGMELVKSSAEWYQQAPKKPAGKGGLN